MILVNTLKEKYGTAAAAVILACRVHFKTATKQDLQTYLDNNKIDYKDIIWLCISHGISPIVYRILLEIKLPEDIARDIKQENYTLINQSWKQALELERIITLFNKNGITAVPYKGIVYSKQFYGDLISRESTDIDLIIKPENIHQIIDLMKTEGYIFEAETVLENLGDKYFKYFKEISCKRFKDNEQEFFFEFHWRIAENFMTVNTRANKLLYEADNALTIFKIKVNVLNPNIHFLSLLIHHSSKDVFNSLKKVIDISQVAYQKEFVPDWDFIFENITKLGLDKAIRVGNSLSEELFGITVNEKAGRITIQESLNFINLTLSDKLYDTRIYNLTAHISRMKLKDTFKEKVKYLLAIIKLGFTPGYADFKSIKLPHTLFPLYFFTKLLRLAAKPFNSKP